MVEKLTHKLNRKPTIAEIAKKLKVSVDRIKELERSVAKMSSLDAPIGEEGDGQVKDIIEDETMAAPDEQLEQFFHRERAQSLMQYLNEREHKIIDMRFGLTNGQTHTLAEIAKELNVSRERVRQLEAATIKKLRQMIEEGERPPEENTNN